MDIIYIKPSPTADSRTCDFSKVDRDTLYESSMQHIADVKKGLDVFCNMLRDAADQHDYTKITEIIRFHRDFVSGFKPTNTWYKMHLKAERHHLNNPDGIRDDVNLIDVIEHIVDNVMSGLARNGEYVSSSLSNELLQKAYENTVKILIDRIIVETPKGEK